MLLGLTWATHSLLAQLPQEYAAQLPTPAVRIVQQIDESKLTTLRGNTHPLASPANDRGAVSTDQPMRRMLILLRRSNAQETALDTLMAAQHDPGSPLFHQWMSPKQFGTSFGPAGQDIETITNWLSSHGFTGITVSNGHTVIEFSGTARQVQSAFHTAIHRYQARGAMHLANQNDPSIPTALASVVAGIVSLNDFGRRSMSIRGPTLRSTKDHPRPQIAPGTNPQFTVPSPDNDTFYGVAPYDFATVYDLLPLWKAGFDGTGQTIAIVGETDINPNDPEQFRALFGLPVNNPVVVIDGTDPGFQPDEIEADLDVEWSGAVAKGAQIQLVTSASTETTSGVDLSALYIVDNNLAPVMSESYGECELFLGTTTNAFESALWQQAAAEGITAFVSSGDQGSAACDPMGIDQNLAVHPMAVNGLASTPYDIAVGGTDFNQYYKWAQYWNSSNDPTTKQSVLGYIPEIPWNDSCGSTTLDAIWGDPPADACNDGGTGVLYLNTIAGSGGPSSCISSDGTSATSCTGGWPKPVWQTGTGVPADGVRDIPDVSLFASNGVYSSAYVVCEVDATGGAGCDPTAATQTFLGVGGTSGSTPAMAGVMAIINQKYGRQGNANFTLYRLAASAKGSSIFHDITTDGNRVACTDWSSDCLVPAGASEPIGTMKGHDSTVGYDMVTGLGSVDIANLVNNWSAVTFTPTTTTLALNGGAGVVAVTHGTPVNATVGVRAPSGSPTGDVSLNGSVGNGSIFLGALNAGSASDMVSTLPGGTYAVTAHYGGDTKFAPSDSSPVSVNIAPEPSTTKVSILNLNPISGAVTPATSVPYGSLLILRTDVDGQSGHGYPTGFITLGDSGTSLGKIAINGQGTAEDTPSNLLLGGMNSLTASYGGDASFNASSGTGNVTVTPTPMLCTLTPNTTYLRAGWDFVLWATAGLNQVQLTPPFGVMVAPTGTITIYSGSTAIVGPTTVVGSGAGGPSGGSGDGFSLPSASLPQLTLQLSQLPTVTAPMTMVYSGDGNYGGCTSPPIQLTFQTGPVASLVNPALSAYQNVPVGTPVTVTGSITPADQPPVYEPAFPTPTGTAQAAIDGVGVGTPVQVTPGPQFGLELTGMATLTMQTAGLSAGMHNVTLSYSGDSNYLSSTSNPLSLWVVSPDFSIATNPPSLTVTNGQTTNATTIQVASIAGFAGTVSFSCTGLPPEAACIFTPATVTNSGSTTLTISTTKAQVVGAGVIARNRSNGPGWLAGSGAILVAFFAVVYVPRRSRRATFFSLIAANTVLLGITCCGGGSSGSAGQQYVTTTRLTASTATPAKGASDTFTATVDAAGPPTSLSGTMQFSVDGKNTGSVVNVNGGAAQFLTSFSTAGSHTVSATYSGDAIHESSTSAAYSVSVPYTTGTVPGTYEVTVTATSGVLSHTTTLTLYVQ